MGAVSSATILVCAAVLAIATSASGQLGVGRQPKPVIVTNDPSAPVPVEVQNPATPPAASEPFHASANVLVPVGQDSAFATFDLVIPAGKRAVIEFVSMSAVFFSGQSPVVASLSSTFGGTDTTHFLLPALVSAQTAGDSYAVSQPMLLFADAGSSVGAFFGRGSPTTDVASANLRISGHFEAVP